MGPSADVTPDIVISDIMMLDMNDYELAHLLKTSPVTNHTAVILLTARASHESRMDGLTRGALANKVSAIIMTTSLRKPTHLALKNWPGRWR